MNPVPDLIEPVVGFRMWQVDWRGLSSIASQTVWREPTLKAMCTRPANRFALDSRPHLSPDPNCSCGIYALHEPVSRHLDRIQRDGLIWGVVSLWGRIEVHHAGMRAEHARVHAVAPRADASHDSRTTLRHIAAKFGGIPVISQEELGAAGNACGRRLGTELIPNGRGPAVRVQIPYRATHGLDRPAFRFVFGERDGHVYPWGWWRRSSLPALGPSWRGAIGDIFARNDGYAVATFARVTPELRQAAEAHLQDWAIEDGWALEIAPGLLPLANPDRRPNGQIVLCQGCRATLRWAGESRRFHRDGFLRSRCQRCGGRLR
jgi:hypothetical protein